MDRFEFLEVEEKLTGSKTNQEKDVISSEQIYIERVNNIINWEAPVQKRTDGIKTEDCYAALFTFEIKALPDFGEPKFGSVKVDKQQEIFISNLYDLGNNLKDISFSVRYYRDERKIRLFLIGRVKSSDRMEAQKKASYAFQRILKDDFSTHLYKLTPVDITKERPVFLELNWVNYTEEIIKKEEILKTSEDTTGKSFYYYPQLFKTKGDKVENNMIDFCQTLINQDRGRIIVDINLIPTRLNPLEKETLNYLINFLGEKSRSRRYWDDYQMKEIEVPEDPNAKKVEEFYKNFIKEYGETNLFLYSIRILSENPLYGLSSDFARVALPPSSSINNDIKMRKEEVSWDEFDQALKGFKYLFPSAMSCVRRFWDQDVAPKTIRRFHRLATLEEICNFFRFPIPKGDKCPGIEKDMGLIGVTSREKKKEDIISIGNFVERGEIVEELAEIRLQDMAKHTLVVGTPGCGKTTFCFHLLYQLWKEYKIPFIVIEPAKTEYRTLKTLDIFKDDMLVFSLGNETVSPFRYNPFEILPKVKVSNHISNLMNCFQGAFPLSGPMPMLLNKALGEMYEDIGWEYFSVGGEDEDLQTPGIDLFYNKIKEKVKEGGYAGETLQNIEAALSVRIDSLRVGEKGIMFNTFRSIPLEHLMKRPVILEMDALNSEEKALMTLFILTTIQEYVKSTRKSGSSLKHIVLIEEAHNIIGNFSKGGEDNEDPRGKVVEYVTNMLAEIRALGEGIVIADQLPTALAPAAIKNTNIKIMHRLTAEDDRKVMGNSMILDGQQFQDAARFEAGDSLVFQEGWDKAKRIKEPNFKGEHRVEESISNEEVSQLMEHYKKENPIVFMPFKECPCVHNTCDIKIRAKSERFLKQKKIFLYDFIKGKYYKDPDVKNMWVTFCNYLLGMLENEKTANLECIYIHLLNKYPDLFTACMRENKDCFCNRRTEKDVLKNLFQIPFEECTLVHETCKISTKIRVEDYLKDKNNLKNLYNLKSEFYNTSLKEQKDSFCQYLIGILLKDQKTSPILDCLYVYLLNKHTDLFKECMENNPKCACNRRMEKDIIKYIIQIASLSII